MICNREGQKDIATAIGEKPTTITAPTGTAHLYSCTYRYTSGALALSVKELDNKASTTSYFQSLAQQLGRTTDKLPLGQGAFWTINSSVVVRKDTNVLVVDTSQLTSGLGTPPETPSDAAVNIALAVLGC